MFGLDTNAADTFTRMSRRNFLRAGFLGVTGLTLADVLRAQANQPAASSDTAVLLLFVHGGPSHLETYDLKPNAPDEIRGPFRPIRTNVRGIDVCEHLPRHAGIAHRFSLIRSLCHDEAGHFEGHRRLLSGLAQSKRDSHESYYPQVGAVVNRVHPAGPTGLPSAIAVGGVVVNSPDYAPGISEGYWPSTFRVPILQRSLPNASLRVAPSQFQDRRNLLRQLDDFRRDLDQSGVVANMDEFQRRAMEILLSGRAQQAFDLSREDARVVDQYGPGYGQEVLVARRLIEAGVRFVTVRAPGSGPGSMAHDWDDHAVNWDMLTAMLARLPRYDQVVSTLIEDLYARGLDQRVLLIVTGEFGRTPRLERMNGRIGRDHYPGAMSILISGGGMPMGQVIGSTDSNGTQPRERRLDPHDLLATIYHFLGIDPHRQFPDPAGRPVSLCQGEPIRELIG